MKSIRYAIAAAVLVAGCGERMSTRVSANRQNRLVWALPFELTTLDPALASDGRSFDVLRQVYEGLVALDEKGLVVPALADRWEVSQNGRTYTFHLRGNATFSDGRRLTADDVIQSFERACRPSTRSPLATDYLGDIDGVPEVAHGVTASIRGIRKLASDRVEIQLRSPRRSFLSKLAYPVCAVLPGGSPPIMSAEKMIGTGPFVPIRRSSVDMELRANPRYWDGAPAMEGILIRFVSDPTTRANLFRTGEVDLTTVAGADVPGIRREATLRDRLVVTPRADIAYLQFNATAMPVLANVKVRQALALCIDRVGIAANQMAGLPTPSATVIPPGVPGHRDVPIPRADPEQARRLMAEAGFPGGRGFPSIEVVFQEAQRDNPVVEAIVTAWRRDLGIDASGRGMPASSLREANLAHRIPCFLTAWVGDYPDPDDFPSMLLRSSSGSNGSSFRDARVDRLLDAADAQADPVLRDREYRQAEQMALDQAPIVPLYFLSDAELISRRVRGLPRSAFGHLSFAKVNLAQ